MAKLLNITLLILDIFLSCVIIAGVTLLFIYIMIIFSSVSIPISLLSDLAITVGLTAGTVYLFQRYPPNKIPLISKSSKQKIILYGLIGGMLLALLIFPYKHILENSTISEGYLIRSDSNSLTILFLLLATAILPLLEELYFRGCIFRLIKHRVNFFTATLISSFLFVLYHNIISYGMFLKLFIVSLLLTFIYEYSGNIISPIIAHVLGNSVWYLAIYLHKYGLI